tara:strand:- start:247 stop:435 length:189 start_codon:yes stop_codon:yes gene_type:complete
MSKRNTIDEFGNESGSIDERQEKKRRSPVDKLKDYVEDRVMGKLTRVKDQKRLEKLKRENNY